MAVKAMEPLSSFHYRLTIKIKTPLGVKGEWFFGGPFLWRGGESGTCPFFKKLVPPRNKGGYGLLVGRTSLKGPGSQAPALSLKHLFRTGTKEGRYWWANLLEGRGVRPPPFLFKIITLPRG